MSRLPVGSLLIALSNDHADEPIDHEILAGDIVLVVGQGDNKHWGETTMLSLTTGVFYRAEYSSDCLYESMEDTYEPFEP